jgi:hypothetical protein
MVKCCDCGFLCVRNRETQELVEVPEYWRQTGQVPRKQLDAIPCCFVKAVPLHREMLPVAKEEEWAQNFLTITSKERDCPKFTPWQEGYTPKGIRSRAEGDKRTDRHRTPDGPGVGHRLEGPKVGGRGCGAAGAFKRFPAPISRETRATISGRGTGESGAGLAKDRRRFSPFFVDRAGEAASSCAN